jgi:formylglycine-generating enzyme required for sulfatase activity
MVQVPGGEFDILLPGLDHLTPEPTADFLMDRHEVTHREFKAFVDAGDTRTPSSGLSARS